MNSTFNINDSTLFFTKNHQWIRFQKMSLQLGFTSEILNDLGEILFAEAKIPKGSCAEKGETLILFESRKTVFELTAPTSGIVAYAIHFNSEKQKSIFQENSKLSDCLSILSIKQPFQGFDNSIFSESQYNSYLQTQLSS